MNLYTTTDGKKVSQRTIDSNYSKMLREKHAGQTVFICEGCGKKAHDNSHIISRKRCKELGRAELVWDSQNVFNACRDCHHKYENYKSGEWHKLKNKVHIVRYLKENDFQHLVKMLG